MSAATEAALVWGVRTSFLDYVRGAEGTISILEPAAEIEDGEFRFPTISVDGAETRFGGEVALWAHEGALTVRLIDPWLIRGTEGEPDRLSVDLWEGGEHRGRRIMAFLRPDGSARLAHEGRVAFNFIYAEGAALSPVRFETA